MTLDDFLARFDRRVKVSGGQWNVVCPGHADDRPSLTVRAGDKGILLNCKAGCSPERVLDVMGLKFVDLFFDKPETRSAPRRLVATYDYYDEAGTLLYQTVRYEPKDFRQRRPDDKGGWIWNLEGVRRVVYRLPQLKGNEAIVVCEGEKDVETLRAHGIPATCNVCGAGKWRDEYTQQIVAAGAKRTVVIPDNDLVGPQHADTVARSCHSAGLGVRLVTLPGVGVKDVSDYLQKHTKDELLALFKQAQSFEPGAVAPSLPATSVTPPIDDWPQPLGAAAYCGVFGEIVRAFEPHTEADPAAILIQQLVMFGSVIGRTAHFRAESDRHYLNLFAVLVGVSSKGRKGVSLGRARGIYEPVDPEWASNCQKSGLSSGEGLIWAVRDPIEKQNPIKKHGIVDGYQTVVEDPGVADKRLLVIESEFASTLRVLSREGNTLSALLRQAWDGADLRVLTKNSPAKATNPHISAIGNITCDELRRYLDATEAANGFGNRFLWVCVRRSKLLPDGGGVPELSWAVARVRQAVEHARSIGEMRRDGEASPLWKGLYEELSAERRGMLGAMTGRAEAQVMRLACLYALSELSTVVRVEHLRAALEVWRYCFQSARYVFGQSVGDPVADEIARAGRAAATQTLTRSEISALFGRNRSANDIGRALAVLEASHVARRQSVETAGRPAEAWNFATSSYERNEIRGEGEGDLSFNSFISYPDGPVIASPTEVAVPLEVEDL